MRSARLAGVAIMFLLGLAAPVGQASAIEPRPDEKERLKKCEKSLCQVLVAKKPASGDLQCPLSKVWSRKTMKEGSANKLRWGFGAAKCEVDLKVPRDMIVGALSAAEIKVTIPSHTVECEVERESSVDKAQITLAPIIEFKDGKAKKIWINVTEIKAPGVVKGVVWSAAQLEDTVGVFQRRMIKSVNKFITEECPKVVAGG
jgi:hypothetical protein